MNVRIASATTIRSGVITSRIETRARVAQQLVHRDRLPDQLLDLGRTPARRAAGRRGTCARAAGRRRAARCSRPNTLSSHQRAASGNDSSRSVSPVGAQSTMITSHSPDSTWRLELQQAEQLVAAGRDGQLLGGDPVDAALHQQPAEPAPATARPVALELVLRLHLLGAQAAADVGRLAADRRLAATPRASAPGRWRARSSARPAAAQRRAVAAATDVLPTPPLPV